MKRKDNPTELKDAKTCDLINELKRRQGVETEYIEPYQVVRRELEGPMVLLLITD